LVWRRSPTKGMKHTSRESVVGIGLIHATTY